MNAEHSYSGTLKGPFLLVQPFQSEKSTFSSLFQRFSLSDGRFVSPETGPSTRGTVTAGRASSDWLRSSFGTLKHSCSSQQGPGCFPASCDSTSKNLLTAPSVTGLRGGTRTHREAFQRPPAARLCFCSSRPS